ncbi:MAG TPA: XrtA system polysaccharide chain length determinant [Rhodanobacteraceae bacterium]|nr:XrtA system polysaccharide chain length determinant [Rhodanobacteraceae bacterium]
MKQKPSVDLNELYQHVLLEARAAWRYRWHALIFAWCVAIAGALLVFSLPNEYKSNALVYADTEALTNPLLHGVTVKPDVRQRLKIITHTLLSRPNLESVADKTGLSLRAATPTDKAQLLDDLGDSVKVSNAGARNLYNISYVDTDKEMAPKVVQAFLEILMNETLGQNGSSSTTAQKFLQQQVNDYSNRLNQAEQKLAIFKQNNLGYLPSQSGGDYFSRLQDAKARLQTLQNRYAATAASGGARGVQRQVNPRVASIDQQIDAYQKKLNNLLLSYTEAYPDVVLIKRKIKQLQDRRKTLPAYITSSGSLPARDANSSSRQFLAAQIADQKRRVAELESRSGKAADVQVTLQQLTRNYATTKKQYDELVSRLNTAKLSQAAVQSGNNLKFRVVNPPVVPVLPESPKRGLLLLIVFAFAIGLGLLFAYFLHKIRPVFTSLKSLRDFSDYPVMGTFQLIRSRALRVAKRGEVIGFCTGVVLLAAILALGFAYNESLANTVQHIFVAGVS